MHSPGMKWDPSMLVVIATERYSFLFFSCSSFFFILKEKTGDAGNMYRVTPLLFLAKSGNVLLLPLW